MTDVNDYRLELARKMGADAALNIQRENLEEAMKRLGLVEGFDVGLEMSGQREAIRLMLDHMRNGGALALLGIASAPIELDWNTMVFRGLRVKGIYGREIFETWYKMAALLETGLNVRPILTHGFPALDFEAAFEIMRSGQSGKVTLDWSDDALGGKSRSS